ncbi:hypothetical protein CVT24_010821 [Panaeolus cyanescens]|uniref:Ricin B lectin domain-containing protein n=1 Tax=Panaeolus cyanescens TaxID=181874 RepID=A0A409VH23_9AGAR|nr:hypothetical protein CVT24_010821 [Panaeolus cyanescens]
MRVSTPKFLQGLIPLFCVFGAEAVTFSDVQHITISNRCPTSIPLYINGKSSGRLSPGTAITKAFDKDWHGQIYTSLNGGLPSGKNATRAGFFGSSGYYYVLQDPDYFNVGVSITPRIRHKDGFCTVASCDTANCGTAFSSPPGSFPVLSHIPPALPLHSCHISKPKYTVTFCPSRAIPSGQDAVRLHPNGNTNKCLEVRGGVFTNGSPVQIYDCNKSAAQNWIIKHGDQTTVQVAGTNFCLDAGSDPKDLVGMKIWQCFKGLSAQSWSYTPDSLIRLSNTEQCLDLTGGKTNNANQVQTYRCNERNTNQLWTTSH